MRYAPILLILLLAGCRDEVAVVAPEPVAMTEEAVSHFCMMSLDEHPGPKAQIHLEGMPFPIFFAQVRDGIAYLKLPERSAGIAAVYVSNMSRAPSWDAPGIGNWIAAEDAIFVVGADVTGGMGAPELAPFETEHINDNLQRIILCKTQSKRDKLRSIAEAETDLGTLKDLMELLPGATLGMWTNGQEEFLVQTERARFG